MIYFEAPRKLIKLVVPILAKHASEADAEVREASLAAIGSVQRMIGDKNVKSMIGDLEKDENKMKKVNLLVLLSFVVMTCSHE